MRGPLVPPTRQLALPPHKRHHVPSPLLSYVIRPRSPPRVVWPRPQASRPSRHPAPPTTPPTPCLATPPSRVVTPVPGPSRTSLRPAASRPAYLSSRCRLVLSSRPQSPGDFARRLAPRRPEPPHVVPFARLSAPRFPAPRLTANLSPPSVTR